MRRIQLLIAVPVSALLRCDMLSYVCVCHDRGFLISTHAHPLTCIVFVYWYYILIDLTRELFDIPLRYH